MTLVLDLDGLIEKARGYPVGTVRKRADGNYRKEATGKWVRVARPDPPGRASFDLTRAADHEVVISAVVHPALAGVTPATVLGWAGLTQEDIDGAEVVIRVHGPIAHVSVMRDDYSLERRYVAKPDGTKYARHMEFTIHKDRGAGRGTRMFASQVAALQRSGFSHIETFACGDERTAKAGLDNGYYTWARLGFDNDVPDPGQVPAHLRKDPLKVSDLMRTPEGRDVWKRIGSDLDMKFDLSGDSLSVKVLRGYLAEKGVSKARSTGRKGGRKVESIDLTPEDEAVLDRVWARLGGEVRKARTHKYISRKRVGNRWVYTYPDESKPKGLPAWADPLISPSHDPQVHEQRVRNARLLAKLPPDTRSKVVAAMAADRLPLESAHFVAPHADLDLASAVRLAPPFVYPGMHVHEVERQIRGRAYEFACALIGDTWHVSDPKTIIDMGYDPRSTSAVPAAVYAEDVEWGTVVFTHNHPSGGTFSDVDLYMADRAGFKELRATTPDGGVWTADGGEKGWPGGWTLPLIREVLAPHLAEINKRAQAGMDRYVSEQPASYLGDGPRVEHDFKRLYYLPATRAYMQERGRALAEDLGYEIRWNPPGEEATSKAETGALPAAGRLGGVRRTRTAQVSRLIKMRSHKYISRKRVGNRWEYTYPDDPTPQRAHAGEAIPTAHRKGAERTKRLAKDYPLPDPTDFDQLPAPLQSKITAHFMAHGGVPREGMVNNLVALYDRVEAADELDGEAWYASANLASVDLAKKLAKPLGAVVGAVAALSPQTAWNENLVCAQWMGDMISADHVVDLDTPITKNWRNEDGDYEPRTWPMRQWLQQEEVDLSGVESGKRLSAYPVEVQAQVMRCWSKSGVHTPGDKPLTAPSETTGRPSSVRWNTGTPNMIKAIELLRGDGSPEHVFAGLNGHKVQNFYNSIVSAGEEGICVDTHAVSAAIGRYKPAGLVASLIPEERRIGDEQLRKLFGSAPRDAKHGVSGTYPLVASAYRDATAAVNARRKAAGKEPLSAAQFQAVCWVAWRKEIDTEAKAAAKRRKAAK